MLVLLQTKKTSGMPRVPQMLSLHYVCGRAVRHPDFANQTDETLFSLWNNFSLGTDTVYNTIGCIIIVIIDSTNFMILGILKVNVKKNSRGTMRTFLGEQFLDNPYVVSQFFLLMFFDRMC